MIKPSFLAPLMAIAMPCCAAHSGAVISKNFHICNGELNEHEYNLSQQLDYENGVIKKNGSLVNIYIGNHPDMEVKTKNPDQDKPLLIFDGMNGGKYINLYGFSIPAIGFDDKTREFIFVKLSSMPNVKDMKTLKAVGQSFYRCDGNSLQH